MPDNRFSIRRDVFSVRRFWAKQANRIFFRWELPHYYNKSALLSSLMATGSNDHYFCADFQLNIRFMKPR